MFRKMSTGLFHTLSGYDLGGFSVLRLESLFQGFAGFILLKRFRFGKPCGFGASLESQFVVEIGRFRWETGLIAPVGPWLAIGL